MSKIVNGRLIETEKERLEREASLRETIRRGREQRARLEYQGARIGQTGTPIR